MSHQQERETSQEHPSGNAGAQEQQQPHSEGHAGQGSESIMKQLREWEDLRASHSGGKRGTGHG